MAFTQVTIVHDYDLPNQAAALGVVEFALPEALHNAGKTVSGTQRAVLDSAGGISIQLDATTDPGTWPTGARYRVTERITGVPARSYYISVPHDQGPTVDLDALVADAGAVVVTGGGSGGGSVSYSPVTMTAVGGTITPDAALGTGPHRYTATTNVALGSPIHGGDGQPVYVEVEASGGSRVLSFTNSDQPAVTIPDGQVWTGTLRYRSGEDEWVLAAGGGYGASSSGGGSSAGSSGQIVAGYVPAGSATPTITHGLNTTDLAAVTIRDAAGAVRPSAWAPVDANSIQLTLSSAPTVNQLRYVITGMGTTLGAPQVRDVPVVQAYAASLTINAAGGNYRIITATGDLTLLPPANGVDGQNLRVKVIASGAQRVVTFDSGIFRAGSLASTLSIPSGKRGDIGLSYESAYGWTLGMAQVSAAPSGAGATFYDLGPGGTSDDSAAITAGMAALASTGGILLGRPNTTYTAIDVAWGGSNITLAGQGPSTVFRMISGTSDNHYLFTAFGSTTDTSGNLTGIGLRDCTLLGTVSTDAFVQHRHLLALGGVSDAHIKNVLFKGWQGDGIYIGHPNGNERHNQRINITDCTFDGVNQDNRNAISVVDAEGLHIARNHFMNTTRADMPGAIDIEPNASYTWSVVRNVSIVDNDFRNIRAGISGVVAVVLQVAQASLTTPATGVVIANNTFVDCPSANACVFLWQAQSPTGTTRKNNVTVANNTAYNTGKPYELDGVRGITFTGNVWENVSNGSAIGYGNICRDINVQGDSYDTVAGSNGVVVYKVDNIAFLNCEWIAAGSGQVFRFVPGSGSVGSTDHLDVMNNRIKGSGPTAVALVSAGHTITSAANNRAFLNRWNGLSTTAVSTVFGVTGNNL